MSREEVARTEGSAAAAADFSLLEETLRNETRAAKAELRQREAVGLWAAGGILKMIFLLVILSINGT